MVQDCYEISNLVLVQFRPYVVVEVISMTKPIYSNTLHHKNNDKPLFWWVIGKTEVLHAIQFHHS